MEDIRIYFIGDSYVNGTGDPQYLGWPGRACAASNGNGVAITCYNLGIRADTSADVLRRWEREVEARRLTLHDARIVFGFGANDCFLLDGQVRVTRTDSETNAHEIMSKASDLLPTLMIGPPPGLDEEQHALRKDMSSLLQDITVRIGVPYLDVIQGLGEAKAWRNEVGSGDNIHPAAGGYAALAQLVLDWPEWWFYSTSKVPETLAD